MNRIIGVAQFISFYGDKVVTFKDIGAHDLHIGHIGRKYSSSNWESYNHIGRFSDYRMFRLEFLYE